MKQKLAILLCGLMLLEALPIPILASQIEEQTGIILEEDAAQSEDLMENPTEQDGDSTEDTVFTDPDENSSTEVSGEDITSEYSIPDEEGIAGDDMGRDGADTEADDSLVNPDEEDAILEDEKEEELSGEDESALNPDGDDQIIDFVEEEGDTVQTPSVDAQSGDYTSGMCGETASYRLDGGTLYIEGKGWVDSSPWRRMDNYSDKILKLSISPGITGLDLYDAFEGCTELREISLPDSLEYIGYAAFENCTSLTRVDFPEKIVINPELFIAVSHKQ